MAAAQSPSYPQPLSICSLLYTEALADKLSSSLAGERYQITHFGQPDDFLAYVQRQKQDIDCLILEASADLAGLTCHLHREVTLLPAIVVVADTAAQAITPQDCIYHRAEVQVSQPSFEHLPSQIEAAMTGFLQLLKTSPLYLSSQHRIDAAGGSNLDAERSSQQRGLSQKLKERLGHFGIFYKRDPHLFFRQMEDSDQQEFLAELQTDYREIVLNYFNTRAQINQKIDAMVAKAFFADLSVSQVLEIHMELMDTFAKQLKLEGRSEEILLDYRLTLIDVIAHLSEMYRRSLPREV